MEPKIDPISEWYSQKDAERTEAWAKLEAARAEMARNDTEDARRAFRRAERAYELAAYVGD